MDVRRRAQDAIAELETNPRGELVIAANEATCIYVLPEVFSQFRQRFPAVQLQVVRSYGSRVVEAVMENSADFGLTQLPVDEKRLQVVHVHREEVRMVVPARPSAGEAANPCCRAILWSISCCCQSREKRAPASMSGWSRWKTTCASPWSSIPPR